jgi:hypothetical protein
MVKCVLHGYGIGPTIDIPMIERLMLRGSAAVVLQDCKNIND